MQIFVTKVAEDKLLAQLSSKNEKFVRLAVKAMGCNGFGYFLDFQSEVKDNDLTFIFEKITLIVDSKSIKYLDQTTIDWQSSLMKSGYVFNNPCAISNCDCGNSFSIK